MYISKKISEVIPRTHHPVTKYILHTTEISVSSIICASDKLELIIVKNMLFFILNKCYFYCQYLRNLHVHIIRVILCHLQKSNFLIKRTRLGTKLQVELKNNFWDNISQPHWELHPTSCKLVKLCID